MKNTSEGIAREALLKIWFESKPTAKSPYVISGNPPMWETGADDDLVLFTRPARTMHKPQPHLPYCEVDGISYQWQRNGKWVGQGCTTTFEDFELNGPSKIDVNPSFRVAEQAGDNNRKRMSA